MLIVMRLFYIRHTYIQGLDTYKAPLHKHATKRFILVNKTNIYFALLVHTQFLSVM